MITERSPAVAGMFYPDNPVRLREMVDDFLADARLGDTVPKAIIVPHAGFVYSGPIAATVYATLTPARARLRRVVLLGPSHRVHLSGLAASSASAYRTPLGSVPLDRDVTGELLSLPQVQVLDDAHELEHSLEVQLPFLQAVLGEFQLVPLVVGDATSRQVGEVLDLLWGGPETLIVISSDLSHYHDYETARRMDRDTSDAIEALRPEDIGVEQACGRVPVKGLLYLARRRGLRARTLDLRNSGDTAGPRNQVVGYGAYAFYE